jgi:hypothetical protein
MKLVPHKICEDGILIFIFCLNPGQPKSLLQLELVEILTFNFFLT